MASSAVIQASASGGVTGSPSAASVGSRGRRGGGGRRTRSARRRDGREEVPAADLRVLGGLGVKAVVRLDEEAQPVEEAPGQLGVDLDGPRAGGRALRRRRRGGRRRRRGCAGGRRQRAARARDRERAKAEAQLGAAGALADDALDPSEPRVGMDEEDQLRPPPVGEGRLVPGAVGVSIQTGKGRASVRRYSIRRR